MQFTLFFPIMTVLLSLFSCTLALPTPRIQPGSLMGRTYLQRADADSNAHIATSLPLHLIAPPQSRTLDRAARFQRRLAMAGDINNRESGVDTAADTVTVTSTDADNGISAVTDNATDGDNGVGIPEHVTRDLREYFQNRGVVSQAQQL